MLYAKKSGFTLIELIMVIVIIGIIAGVTLPKFVNFKTRAIERSEDYIVTALNTAIKIKFTQNVARGSEPDNAWPCRSGNDNDNPFTLLEQSPPNVQVSFLPLDGKTWGYYFVSGESTWRLYCPHYVVASKGRRYHYKYQNTESWPSHQTGDFWREFDFGH